MKKIILIIFLMFSFSSNLHRGQCDGLNDVFCDETSKKFNDVTLKVHDGKNIFRQLLHESLVMYAIVQRGLFFLRMMGVKSIRLDLLGRTEGLYFWDRLGGLIGVGRLDYYLFMLPP